MYQMASVSLRATSTRATRALRCFTEPLLGALVVVAVARMLGGVDGRLDQRPAQLWRAVLGQRAALIAAAGLVHPGTQPGIAAQLLGRREPGDVTQLGGNGIAQHPGDP